MMSCQYDCCMNIQDIGKKRFKYITVIPLKMYHSNLFIYALKLRYISLIFSL